MYTFSYILFSKRLIFLFCIPALFIAVFASSANAAAVMTRCGTPQEPPVCAKHIDKWTANGKITPAGSNGVCTSVIGSVGDKVASCPNRTLTIHGSGFSAIANLFVYYKTPGYGFGPYDYYMQTYQPSAYAVPPANLIWSDTKIEFLGAPDLWGRQVTKIAATDANYRVVYSNDFALTPLTVASPIARATSLAQNQVTLSGAPNLNYLDRVVLVMNDCTTRNYFIESRVYWQYSSSATVPVFGPNNASITLTDPTLAGLVINSVIGISRGPYNVPVGELTPNLTVMSNIPTRPNAVMHVISATSPQEEYLQLNGTCMSRVTKMDLTFSDTTVQSYTSFSGQDANTLLLGTAALGNKTLTQVDIYDSKRGTHDVLTRAALNGGLFIAAAPLCDPMAWIPCY